MHDSRRKYLGHDAQFKFSTLEAVRAAQESQRRRVEGEFDHRSLVRIPPQSGHVGSGGGDNHATASGRGRVEQMRA